MTTHAASKQASIREAEESEIPALVSLVLTSYRQFELFDYLYSPLRQNQEAAHDTVFYWRRRMLKDLLDPSVTIYVAEVPNTLSPSTGFAEEARDPLAAQSWSMFKWTEQHHGLSQASIKVPGKQIVGFAIWKEREGVEPGAERRVYHHDYTWINKLRTILIDLELSFWSLIYQRKDQDAARYREYLKAEEQLEEEFYQKRCYYLDVLCVDFRYQRLGIGALLLDQGISNARQLNLDACTEASIKGLGLYKKSGFEQIGSWKVSSFDIPVMRLMRTAT